MKIVNDMLYIEYTELLACGVSDNTLKSAKLRKSPSWQFIEDPDDRRRVLISYEKMTKPYKDKVILRFGNPYDYMAKQPIWSMVSHDINAERFYIEYQYGSGKTLPLEHIERYTATASFSNMLLNVQENKKDLVKGFLKLKSIEQFWVLVYEIIESNNKLELPTSYRRLLAKLDKYKADGYSSLIDWRFGNNNPAKVKDETAEAVLLEMLAHGNQYDDVIIAYQYNLWAKENGYETILPPTVGDWRRKREHEIIMYREGNMAFNEKYIKQAKGFRPTFPLALVESDDNHLDLLFVDMNDMGGSKYYNKYKAILVVDSYNDYILGYAYSMDLSIELVKAAYYNAMYHIRELTGGWYLPHETKTDRWALATLRPFYESMGKYFDTPVGSKHRGYIEQLFRTPHWKRCLKIGANNYTGNNLTARSRGVNIDSMELAKKDRPQIGDEAAEQIEQFVYRLRHMPYLTRSGGAQYSKQQQWLQAWSATPDEQKRPISDMQFLLKFGVEHNYKGEGISITNRGVEPMLLGEKRSYDLAEYNMEHIGKKVSIYYDPADLSKVLVTDGGKIRLLAYDAMQNANSRALVDSSEGRRTYLNTILNQKREQVAKASAASDRRKEVLSNNNVSAESILLSGVVKELKQPAEAKILQIMLTGKSDEDEQSIWDQI